MAKAKRIPLSEMDALGASAGASHFAKRIAALAAVPDLASDEALAMKHRIAVTDAIGPLMAALDAATADGYNIGFSLNKNAQGNLELQPLQITKTYRP